MPKRADIAIVIPHGSRSIEYKGARHSIQAMINEASKQGYTCAICDPSSASVARNRNVGVHLAKKMKVNWLLMADDDMIFPPDTLTRLISAKKEVVSGLCTTRNSPYIITGYKKLDNQRYRDISYEELNQDGLTEVDGVGGACVLVEMGVFDKIPAPWYAMPPSYVTPLLHSLQFHLAGGLSLDKILEQNKVELPTKFSMTDCGVDGEDLYFSGLVKKFGYRIYLDAGLEVGHIGDWVYSLRDHLSYRGKDERTGHTEASPATAENPTDSG
ncbi:hypothetical protein LCGC14_1890700 [marine sediment metagenome]|uniref:Glycosyltransferase 2-like domain-containing protein n=1 Tax=marine sediment metagenome TaxID=412755 RepID=A0A0F9IXS6_9ZZZZ